MMLLHTGRQAGKTTQAMAWVSHGQKRTVLVCQRREHLHWRQVVTEEEREVCDAREMSGSYPGWTRVLVVITLAEFERLKKEWWSRLEDFDHRVYPYEEWRSAHNVDPTTEVCVDNLDLLLSRDLRLPGHLVAATITAEPWENLAFHESVHQRS